MQGCEVNSGKWLIIFLTLAQDIISIFIVKNYNKNSTLNPLDPQIPGTLSSPDSWYCHSLLHNFQLLYERNQTQPGQKHTSNYKIQMETEDFFPWPILMNNQARITGTVRTDYLFSPSSEANKFVNMEDGTAEMVACNGELCKDAKNIHRLQSSVETNVETIEAATTSSRPKGVKSNFFTICHPTWIVYNCQCTPVFQLPQQTCHFPFVTHWSSKNLGPTMTRHLFEAAYIYHAQFIQKFKGKKIEDKKIKSEKAI